MRDFASLRQDIRFETVLCGAPITFHSTWGLFSPTAIDEGSRLLLDQIEVKETDTILDVGCGYGAIGLPLARQALKGSVHLIDNNFTAVEYAKKNAALNGITNCEMYLSNGLSQVPKDMQFDVIVSNLPAKVGKEFFWILLEDAKLHLKPGGSLYVVVISGLKEYIKRNFTEVFGNYEKIKQSKSYTIARAVRK